MKVRYFTTRPGRPGPDGKPTARYFWQPSKALLAEGWKLERLPDELGAAVSRAQQLNADIDRWRQGLTDAPTKPKAAPAAGGSRSTIIKPRSVAHLIRLYKASRFYADRAKNTQDSYRLNMDMLEAWAGDFPVASITFERADALYKRLTEPNGRDADGNIIQAPIAPKPSKASHLIMMLFILLQHARRLNWIRENPCARFGLRASPFAGKLWPADAVSLMAEHADRLDLHSIGTAIVVNHWIGQRLGDVLALARSAYRDGRFRLKQHKTAEWVDVPDSPWVAERLEAELEAQAGRGITSATHLLLCETTGQPWKLPHFQHTYAAVRAAAAAARPQIDLPDGSSLRVEELEFRHLRHTAVTEMANAGCTTIEISGVTGHTIASVDAILERYVVKSSALATNAAAKRLASVMPIVLSKKP